MLYDLEEIKNKVISSFLEAANSRKEKFCKNFALIARFAGWTWNFKEITYDDICITYEILVTTCLEGIRTMEIKGDKWVFTTSTGRINFVMIYYAQFNSVQIDIAVDIIS